MLQDVLKSWQEYREEERRLSKWLSEKEAQIEDMKHIDLGDIEVVKKGLKMFVVSILLVVSLKNLPSMLLASPFAALPLMELNKQESKVGIGLRDVSFFSLGSERTRKLARPMRVSSRNAIFARAVLFHPPWFTLLPKIFVWRNGETALRPPV